MTAQSDPLRTALLTVCALTAFAANSIFCRLALLDGLIDPAVFAAIRLGSGAVMLWLLCGLTREKIFPVPGTTWVSAIFLIVYALPFTYAYTWLTAGTGALILFGSVQITMILAAVRSGYRPSIIETGGTLLAFGGLVYLTSPGFEGPTPGASLLMALAGAGWGLYTLRGKRSGSPLADTAANFILAATPAVAIGAIELGSAEVRAEGIWLAVASGAVASGLGYAVWYAALRGLTQVRAAVVQLSVPVIAAAGGVIFLAEHATPRLAVAACAVLGGIGITIAGRRTRHRTLRD